MKTRHNTVILLAMGVLLAGLLSACTKDKINDGNNNVSGGTGRGFRATAEGDGSKTYLEGTAVKWEEGDLISVRNSTGPTKGFVLDKGANTSNGTFMSDEVGDNFFTPNYTAIYPTVSTAGTDNAITSATTATFDLPAEQSYKENSFGVKAMPMMARSTDENLEFKNVLGGVVFPLTYTHDLENCTYLVKRVVVTSNNTADVLWGTCATTISGVDDAANLSSSVTNSATDKHIITLDCSAGGGVALIKDTPIDFTVMVPAGTLESGFTLTVIGDVSYQGTTTTDTELYTQSVSWDSGEQPNFIVRSRLSKVKTAIAMPLTGYTVEYLNYYDGQGLVEPRQMDDRFPVGWEVTENAIDIDGWQIYGDSEIQFKLKPDGSENVITFYYVQQVWVTVKYVDDSDNLLANPEGYPAYIGEIHFFYAKEIEGYTPREESITTPVVEDGQEVIFVYDVEQYITVTIRYVIDGTDIDIAEPGFDVFPKVVGDTRTYTARNIEYYSCEERKKHIRIAADTPSEVDVKFEYVAQY